MAGPVPQEWTDMCAALQQATVAGPVMRDARASDANRDIATQQYVAAADIVVNIGGIIAASGCIGGLSVTANTITASGIIFR